MSCGTHHFFKSESDLESENEGEAKESEGSVDKPQSTSFPVEWAYTTVLTQRLTDVRSATRRSFKRKVSSLQLLRSSQDAFLSFSPKSESSMFGEIAWGHLYSRNQRWNSSTRLGPSLRHVVYWRSSNAIANPKRCCRIPWRTTWRCWLETDVLLPTSSELEVTLTLMAW